MIFGIDFGTTNSYLARYQEGVAESVSGEEGLALPSEIIGEEESFSSIKRYLGRRPEELDEMGLDYILTDGKLRVAFDGKTFSPEELASKVFEKIARRGVRSGVLAVPAHYDDGQRQATKEAARRAGINVTRLVHEPTAAALASGARGERILIFDLGGGTLDISLLEKDEALFEVVRTSGNRSLGGDDLDILLASEIASRADISFTRELLLLACQVKHRLSEDMMVETDYCGLITRGQLEEVAQPFLERIRDSLEHFRDAAPDELVLVGGMSRMPAILHLLEDFFDMRATEIKEPETAVARGAAIYAASLAGEDDSLLLDVTSLALGVEVEGEGFQEVVPGGTTIPLFRERVFTTTRDDQLSVEINILQGESEDPRENSLLGRMRLMGIPPAAAGVPDIWVAFEINEEGILSAWAHHPESGLREEIQISERSFSDRAPDSE